MLTVDPSKVWRHVIRMQDTRLPKKVLFEELKPRKRIRGGQKKRFKDTYEVAVDWLNPLKIYVYISC